MSSNQLISSLQPSLSLQHLDARLAAERRRAAVRRLAGLAVMVSLTSGLLVLSHLSTPAQEASADTLETTSITVRSIAPAAGIFDVTRPSTEMAQVTRALETTFLSSPAAPRSIHVKWHAVLRRHELTAANQMSMARGDVNAFQVHWGRILERIQEPSSEKTVRNVHEYFNRYKFSHDSEVWGVRDYWATPKELMEIGSGDCEDSAIAKYLALRALGYPDGHLRLVVALDESQFGSIHAFVMVKLSDKILVLDQQKEAVSTIDAVRHYKPIYAVNGMGVWMYSDGIDALHQSTVLHTSGP